MYNGNETRNPVYRYSDLLKDFFGEESFSNKVSPRFNILEQNDAFILELAVPGLKKSDIAINVESDILKISHKNETEEDDSAYRRREFNYNGFEKSFNLPEIADTEKIKATMENGILNVHIPKKEESIKKGPREIKVS
jgi:HSP20 family protein